VRHIRGGRRYVFRVKARNTLGSGVSSTPVAAFLRTRASAPRNLKVVMRKDVLSITWTRPASLGGSPSASHDVFVARLPHHLGSRPVNRRVLHSRHDVTTPGTYLVVVVSHPHRWRVFRSV
jgi:hypothetical protein